VTLLASHRLDVNVLLSNINFLSFLLFLMCYPLWVAVNSAVFILTFVVLYASIRSVLWLALFLLGVTLLRAFANPSCVPNLKTLAVIVAEITGRTPHFFRSSLTQCNAHFFQWVCFYDGPWETQSVHPQLRELPEICGSPLIFLQWLKQATFWYTAWNSQLGPS